MSEPLKCGPCRKCVKRASDMLLDQKYAKFFHNADTEKIKLQEKVADTEEARALVTSATETPGTSTEVKRSVGSWQWEGGKSNLDLGHDQESDLDIGPILLAKKTGVRPNWQDMQTSSPATRHYWLIWEMLEIHDGLLFRLFSKQNGTDKFKQFIVPRVLRNTVLKQMHDSILSGHLGVKKTKLKTLQHFYWFAMKEDVAAYVRGCEVCARNKKPNKTPAAPLGTIPVGGPWDVLAMDYIGPFPETPRGNRYILVLTDLFTKYVEVFPVPDQTAEVCAALLVDKFIARWGCPLSFHSDQGRTFESEVFRQLTKMLGVRKTRTTARNPKCNGQCERFNRTLLSMIKAYLCDEQTNWDLYLGCLAGAYRATPSETTTLTPNMLTLGREVRLPVELVFDSETRRVGTDVANYGEYVNALRRKMQQAHDVARLFLKSCARRRKDRYDVKLAFNTYRVGDAVWYLHETRKVGVSQKLQPLYDGPFMINKKMSDVNFSILMGKVGQERVVHHDKLKPYEGRNIPKWIMKAREELTVT